MPDNERIPCRIRDVADIVMSDSEDSAITYTEVSSPFEDLSDIGSPRVDGLPMMTKDPYPYVVAAFQAPPSPDYVPGPEEPEQVPPSPEFVPEPVYSEFMPPEDEVFPPEEQPLHVVVSPTTNSPGYIADSDPEEDKEDLKEDLKEDPTDYPADGGDDDDDESSDEDEDDDDVEEDENEEEEEEEHPTPANSVPLHIPSPPLPVSPPLTISPPPLPASPTYPLGYRAAMIRLRAESPSTSHPLPLPSPIVLLHTRASVAMMRVAAPSTYILASQSETPPSGTPPVLPIPLPTPSPPLLLPSTNCSAGVSEVGESLSALTARPTRGFRADYRFVGTLDDEIMRDPEREDTYEIYERLDDAQDDRLLMSGQLNMLRRDRHAYARTARLM
ncbi:hypothetical protein Tco_1020423 [Tanacetum coccineum]